MFATNNPPQTSTCPRSKTEMVDSSVKHVQSKNPINTHRFTIIKKQQAINGLEPNKHSQMYHKQKLVGSQQIRINIFIIKNHYFIFRSIPDKRQGSEFTSVLLKYLKTYFHKVELSALLKSRKCMKITININDSKLKQNYSTTSTSDGKFY